MKTPDVNLLVYAINADAQQHAPAREWLQSAFRDSAGVGLTWPALTGFLRLTTNRGVLVKPLSIPDALRFVDEWLAHPHARILSPGDRHASLLARLLIGAGRGGNLVSDAHLAAIAIEHGAVLGTFDRDFERFAGLQLEWLQGDAVHEDSHARIKGRVRKFDDPLSPVGDAWHADTQPQRRRQRRRQ